MLKNNSTALLLMAMTLAPAVSTAQLNFQSAFTLDNNHMIPADMTSRSDSGVVIATNAGFDSYLVRFDGTGNKIWQKKYSGPSYATARSLHNTAGNGMLMTVTCSPNIQQNYDLGVVRMDSAGAIQWAYAIGGPSSDFANDAIQTSGGAYLIAGSTITASQQQGALVALAASGGPGWSKLYRDTTAIGCQLNRVLQGAGVKYILTTRSDYGNFSANGVDGGLIKTDGTGTIIWNKVYHFSDWTEFTDVVEVAGGGLVITGTIDLTADSVNNRDILLMKTDSLGNVQWARAFTRPNDDLGSRVVPTPDGGFLLSGVLNAPSSTSTACFIKVDAAGAIQWTNQFTTNTTFPSGNVALPSRSSGYFLFSNYQVSPIIRSMLLRVGNNGMGYCNDSSPQFTPVSVTFNINSPFVSTGTAAFTTTSLTYNVTVPVYNEVPICVPSGIAETETAAITVYPNPSADGFFQVDVNLSDPVFTCFDLCGKRVAVEAVRIHEYSYRIRLETAGMYLLEIRSGNRREVIKLLNGTK